MLGGADNPNGELPSYITGADNEFAGQTEKHATDADAAAQQAEEAVANTTDDVRKSAEILEEMRRLVTEGYGNRFENFEDIVSGCTTAMLKLERPKVESVAVRLMVAEDVNYEYTDDIHGQCDIAES
ncbi:TPA: hypothetical protein ACS508_002334 [Salmonella enterica]